MNEIPFEVEMLLLNERVKQMKMQELFHEPCYWEDEEDEEDDFENYSY